MKLMWTERIEVLKVSLRWCLLLVGGLVLAGCAKPPHVRPAAEDYSRSVGRKPGALCVFMDGTRNDYEHHTNVRRLYEQVSAPNNPRVLAYYDPGVGSNSLPFSGMVGGAGFSQNMAEAYTFLRQNYVMGDRIYLFGFSRGARQAQVLCQVLNDCGLAPRDPGEGELSEKATAEARDLIRKWKAHQRKRPGKDDRRILPAADYRVPQIEFVGIFDSVESLANNVWEGQKAGSLRDGEYVGHKYYRYELPGIVRRAYHAMALDEQRGMYPVIKWTVPATPPRSQVMEQVWFAGGHGDIGGGYAETQCLAAIPLNWMISKLKGDPLVGKQLVFAHEEPLAPLTDTNAFWFAKPLSKVRQNLPRTREFWFDRRDHPEFPGILSMTRFDRVKPRIHATALARMREPRLRPPRSKREKHLVYRPRQFYVRPGFGKIWPDYGMAAESWPMDDSYVFYDHPPDAAECQVIDWGDLRKVLVEVRTPR